MANKLALESGIGIRNWNQKLESELETRIRNQNQNKTPKTKNQIWESYAYWYTDRFYLISLIQLLTAIGIEQIFKPSVAS